MSTNLSEKLHKILDIDYHMNVPFRFSIEICISTYNSCFVVNQIS